VTDVLDFTCPRCATDVHEEFYGPCESCRSELVAMYAGQARDVETEAYEPKMNVVPNQVATKD
jgi:hypothetical protein